MLKIENSSTATFSYTLDGLKMTPKLRYLVSGASGYIGMHVVDELLKRGHNVRATVRNLKHKEKTIALKRLGPVELVEADLLDIEAWDRAVQNVDVIIHLAFSAVNPESDDDENAIIQTAVQGSKLISFFHN